MYEVRDVIYGFIKFDEQERDIINHPAFQRLRRIRQLSLTDMVYSGATHTRFEHSIGVMQMATDMYDCITEKSGVLLQQGIPNLPHSMPIWTQPLTMRIILYMQNNF